VKYFGKYLLDEETSQRVFRRNVRTMIEQGASLRDGLP
jgi:hypothetical protein